MIFISLVVLLLLSTEYINANEPVIVHTNYGDVLGYQTEMARVFYGIPYAQPPVDILRWQSPVPIDSWSPKTLNVTQPPPSCPQTSSFIKPIQITNGMSEDCLYVNIFTPLFNNSLSTTLLPVMLFIHGGDFQWGDASQSIYNAERLVNTTNVVVALIQYRLGVLGFLATGTGPNDIKGNYGILDQRLAIAWVKNNINVFGGDPNQITLFGQSAGAQSTALHLVTGAMQSYFQRAIIQSPPMTVPFRTYMEYVTPTVLLAEQLHCANSDIGCFRNRSSAEIIAAQNVVNDMMTSLNPLLFFEPWLPVIDDIIIRGQLIDIVRNVSFPLKPAIIGTDTDECLDFVYTNWHSNITSAEYFALVLSLFGEKGLKVFERYPPTGEGDQRRLVARLCTQWVFACSTRVFVRNAATYTYAFGYPVNMETPKPSITCRGGACHGDELTFIFESNWASFTDADRRVSQSMATYWTNFAKSTDPNEPLTVPLVWPNITTGNETYMFIQDPLQIGQGYLKDDCDFWDEIGYKPFV